MASAEHSGYLTKLGSSWKTWHERYFVLTGGVWPVLKYYSKESAKSAKGELKLYPYGAVRKWDKKKGGLVVCVAIGGGGGGTAGRPWERGVPREQRLTWGRGAPLRPSRGLRLTPLRSDLRAHASCT